jgi:transposase InsO family protein
VKYAWIAAQREFALGEMCAVLNVSVSGYRAWKRGGKPDRKRLTDSQMLALIQAIHAEFKGAYSSPRMTEELRQRGFAASKKRVERLMRENGIRARHKRRYKITTDSKHGLPVAENTLARKFMPTAPNQVWTSDITYLWTDEGWLYLAIVLDLFNREVVGWSLKPRMTADIVTDALTMAWFRRKPAAGVLHHSDRGSQLRQPGLPDQAQGLRHGWLDEPERKLLGQRPDRELVQQLQERADTWRVLCDTGRNDGHGVRVHRGVLQPQAASLDPRLQGANPVLARLARRSTDEKTGSMRLTCWKTKNRGNLSRPIPSPGSCCWLRFWGKTRAKTKPASVW